MPTGYTALIEKGQTFEDFALGCARAFGACVMQRDDPMGDKPKLRQEGSYHENRILEASAELGAFQTMDQNQRVATGQELRTEAMASAQKYLNDKIVLKGKYEDMIRRAQAWNPPSPDHEQLKQFMIEQINSSIDFDCNISYALEELDKKTKMKPLDYYNEKVKSLEWDVNYHTEQLEKDRERQNQANDWILKLYESLGVDYE